MKRNVMHLKRGVKASNWLVAVFIDIDSQMSGIHPRAIVQISIVHRQHIDIMEDETFPFPHFHRFNETDIVQCTLIEPVAMCLKNDEHLVFKLLSLQKSVQIFQKNWHLIFAIPACYQHSDTIPGNAFFWLIISARFQTGCQLIFNIFHCVI